MEMNEIRREKILVTSIGTLEDSIAQEAAKVLGYNAVAAKSESEAELVLPKLRAALAKLEIEVLNGRDVARYKMDKRHAAENEALIENPDRDPLVFWSEIQIGQYRKPIPDFVLNKTIQIKREVPECKIEIDELQTHPDPFLKVSIGYAEEYYVEVWSEPGFEKR